MGPLPESFRVVPWGARANLWERDLRLNRLLKPARGPAAHTLPAAGVSGPLPLLVTVHDLADFLYPRHSGWRKDLRCRQCCRADGRARQVEPWRKNANYLPMFKLLKSKDRARNRTARVTKVMPDLELLSRSIHSSP